MNTPLCYHLCDQTVTVYRLQGDKVHRFLTERAHLSYELRRRERVSGADWEVPFRLILPAGEEISLQPGDRIYSGVGPEVTKEQWPGFLPAAVAGLSIVEYVKPFFWMGELCHTEAGHS